MILLIDDLIRDHWHNCDVGLEETPEDYASRHEQARLGWVGLSRHCVWVRWSDGSVELLRTEGDTSDV